MRGLFMSHFHNDGGYIRHVFMHTAAKHVVAESARRIFAAPRLTVFAVAALVVVLTGPAAYVRPYRAFAYFFIEKSR